MIDESNEGPLTSKDKIALSISKNSADRPFLNPTATNHERYLGNEVRSPIEDYIKLHKSKDKLVMVDAASSTGVALEILLWNLINDGVINLENITVIRGDINRDVLLNKEPIQAIDTEENIHFIEEQSSPVALNLTDLPFPDNYVDIIFEANVGIYYEGHSDLQVEMADEVSRVLKPGGLYIHGDDASYRENEMYQERLFVYKKVGPNLVEISGITEKE